MAVPARNIGSIKAHQPAGFNNHVFENLIDRMTNVNITIGIRRAIVQNEFRLPCMRCPNGFVEFIFLPLGYPLRLALGQIAPHWKSSFQKVNGIRIGFIRHRLFSGNNHAHIAHRFE